MRFTDQEELTRRRVITAAAAQAGYLLECPDCAGGAFHIGSCGIFPAHFCRPAAPTQPIPAAHHARAGGQVHFDPHAAQSARHLDAHAQIHRDRPTNSDGHACPYRNGSCCGDGHSLRHQRDIG